MKVGDLVKRKSKEDLYRPNAPDPSWYDMPGDVSGLVVSDYGRTTLLSGRMLGADYVVRVMWLNGTTQEHVLECYLEVLSEAR